MKLKRFTIRLKPFLDESFISFMIRLSNANGIDLKSLCLMVKKKNGKVISNDRLNYLNIFPLETIDINKLSQNSNVDSDKILKTTFYYILNTFSDNRNFGQARYIQGMIREDFCYCPECLKEKAYHRLLWNVKDLKYCLKHRVKLLESCPYCNKKIALGNFTAMDTCPHCGKKLFIKIEKENLDNNTYNYQKWLAKAWTVLLNNKTKIKCEDTALKVIYILNGQNTLYDNEIVKNRINNQIMYEAILRYARGTLKNKRTLHLSFIFKILYQYNMDIEDFIKIEVPVVFKESLTAKKESKLKRAACLAPWCNNFNRKGNLKETSTSFHGNFNYYLICPECGCEYAYNNDNQLVERTYFIKAYYLFRKYWNEDIRVSELQDKTGFTNGQIKRCSAYFFSRGMFQGYITRKYNCIRNDYLQQFIAKIMDGSSIAEILKWKCWKRDFIWFLIHRYHKDTMNAINSVKKKSKSKNDTNSNVKKVYKLVDEMYKSNEDISIINVCKKINLSAVTIRRWGCNVYISELKKKQMRERTIKSEIDIYNTIEKFFEINVDKKIYTKDLYKYLGVIRGSLWRKNRGITNYITLRVKRLNDNLMVKDT